MRYDAFISYSHGADARLAPALQRALHRFAKPWHRARAVRVFRDETNLALAHNLPETLTAALRDSAHFLLLASPRAARSPWVMQECAYWREHKPADRILIVLSEGSIAWDRAARDFDWARTDAIPATLKGAFTAEPLYLDLRWARTEEHFSARDPRFADAVARISAVLRGMSLDEIAGEDVRQHRRTRRMAAAAIALIGVFAAAATAGGLYARHQERAAVAARDAETAQRKIAVDARDIAEDQRRQAERARAEADRQRGEAERQRNEALATQSRFLAQAAREAAARGDHELAALLVREALPAATPAGPARPLVPEASAAMRRVLASDPLRLVLHGHTQPVFALALSPDGLSLVSAANEQHALIWDVRRGNAVRRLDGPSVPAMSADGRIVAFLEDSEATVWSAFDGRRLLTLTIPGDPPVGFCLSPDGGKLVTWTATGETQVIDAGSGRALAAFTDAGLGIKRCRFSADGTRMATAALAAFTVWDLATGQRSGAATTAAVDNNLGDAVVLDRTGTRLLASRNYGAQVDIWDVATARRLGVLEGHAGGINAIAIDPANVRAATAGSDGTVRLWTIADARPAAILLGHEGPVLFVAFSGDGGRIVTGGQDRSLRLWEAATGKLLASFAGHGAPVTFALLDPAGDRVFAGTADGAIRVWSVRPAEDDAADIARRLRSVEAVSAAVPSPDGRLLATSEINAPPRVRAADNFALRTAFAQPLRPPLASWWSPDGRLIATAAGDGTLRVWSALDGAERGKFELPPRHRLIHTAAFDSAGARVLVWSTEVGGASAIQLFDIGTASLVARRDYDFRCTPDGRCGPEAVRGAAFSGDLAVFVTGDRSGVARVRAVLDDRLVATLEGNADNIAGTLFAPGGRRLAAISDRAAHIWDTATGRRVSTLRPGDSGFVSISLAASSIGAFSNDGRLLVTLSADHAPRVWEAETGRLVSILRGHTQTTSAIVFSPDGLRIATAAADNTIVVWHTATGTRIATLRGEPTFASLLHWLPGGDVLLAVHAFGLKANWWTLGSYTGSAATDAALLEWRTLRTLTAAERARFGLAPPAPAPPTAPPEGSTPSCDSLAGHPLDPRVRPRQGAAAIADPEAAAALCEKAVAATPDDARRRYQWARALYFAGKHRDTARILAHASVADYPRALVLLADLHEAGEGVPRDVRRALALYRKADALGDPQAACSIAALQRRGRGGLPPDAERADAILRRAAQAGSPCAHGSLADALLDAGSGGEALYHAIAAAALWSEAGFDALAAAAAIRRANLARRVSANDAIVAWRRLHAAPPRLP